jgi:hypothetical protein
MPHILHLVKDAENQAALGAIRAQAADPATRLTIVLMHDARRLAEPLPGEVYRLHAGHADAGAPAGQPGARVIDSAALLDLIFAADSVVTW